MAVTAAWIYGTGNAITIPQYRYLSWQRNGFGHTGFEVEGGFSKNSFRMRPYHRFDISLEIQNKKNKYRNWKSAWVFGVYNVYNRNNPYFISAGFNENRDRVFKQNSIFPIIPSFSYQFKF